MSVERNSDQAAPLRSRPDKRRVVLLAVVAVLVAAAAAAFVPLQAWWEESRVVARVNGEPLTRGALEQLLSDQLMLRQLEQELGGKKATPQEMQRMALRELIVRQLFLQEAARRRLMVAEVDLDRAIAARRGQFKGAKAFREWLDVQGLDEARLREDTRTEILVTQVRVALVEGARPTDEELQAYYDSHKQEMTTSEELKLRVIAVKEKAAADEISGALGTGGDFARLARDRSTGFRAVQGGDIGWVDPRIFPPPLGKAVRGLKAGTTSPPLQGKEGFYIVRAEDRRPGRALSLAEARPAIEKRLLGAKQQQVIQMWLAQQERNSKIELTP